MFPQTVPGVIVIQLKRLSSERRPDVIKVSVRGRRGCPPTFRPRRWLISPRPVLPPRFGGDKVVVIRENPFQRRP